MSKTWTIYALARLGEVFYVGASQNMPLRIKDHRKRFGKDIDVLALEECGSNWRDREHYWIAHHRNLGCALLNKTAGRNGGEGLSDQTRAKLSAKKRGVPKARAHAAKISMSQKGQARNWSPEGAAKVAANHFAPGHISTGQGFRDPANRRNRREAVRKSRLNWWAKMDAHDRAELATKVSAGQMRRDPEVRREAARKGGFATKGIPKAGETKARMAEARRAWWARKRAAEAAASESAQSQDRPPEPRVDLDPNLLA
jgi:general stress protein YciG